MRGPPLAAVRLAGNPCGKGRLGLGETAVSLSPRAGSVASFRSSEGGAGGRCHTTDRATRPRRRAVPMTDADGGSRGTGGFLPELAGLLLSEETVSGLLDVIVNLAVSGVEGVAGASVSMVVRDGEQLETSNASSEVIRDIDEAQYFGGGVRAWRPSGPAARLAWPFPARRGPPSAGEPPERGCARFGPCRSACATAPPGR